jgi:hypothetical protein
MSNKMTNLQNALTSSSGRAATLEPALPPVRTETAPRGGTAAASRAGRENIAAWLPVGFKKSIRLVQAKLPGNPSLQELMTEAFNDLFIKYNVPTVSE